MVNSRYGCSLFISAKLPYGSYGYPFFLDLLTYPTELPLGGGCGFRSLFEIPSNTSFRDQVCPIKRSSQRRGHLVKILLSIRSIGKVEIRLENALANLPTSPLKFPPFTEIGIFVQYRIKFASSFKDTQNGIYNSTYVSNCYTYPVVCVAFVGSSFNSCCRMHTIACNAEIIYIKLQYFHLNLSLQFHPSKVLGVLLQPLLPLSQLAPNEMQFVKTMDEKFDYKIIFGCAGLETKTPTGARYNCRCRR